MKLAEAMRTNADVPHVVDIENATHDNQYYRHVLFTSKHLQLVVMSLSPGEDIGMETHDMSDQFIRVEEGKGIALLDGMYYDIEEGSAIIIPIGVSHNIINTSSDDPLRLYMVYSRPEHKDGQIDPSKPEEDVL